MINKKFLPKIGYFSIGIILTVLIFLLFGIPTALIPTSFYTRMIEVKMIDYIFLSLTSILLAVYFTLVIARRKQVKQSGGNLAFSGTLFGIFSFGCPICNVILVTIFGATAILTYFEPYRSWLGIVSVVMLSLAVYYQVKIIYHKKKCITCDIK